MLGRGAARARRAALVRLARILVGEGLREYLGDGESMPGCQPAGMHGYWLGCPAGRP